MNPRHASNAPEPHAEEGQRCETCRFWRLVNSGDRFNKPTGPCRRYAPRGPVAGNVTCDTTDAFVFTKADDWCGEYQPATLQQDHPK